MVVLRIVLAILLFSVIVLFHEFGHFIMAKACDVQVNEFAIGLGPNLVKLGKGETKFCIKAFPFGGACTMEGEDEEMDNPRALTSKKLWQRFLIIFAGPFFNFIMAFIFALILLCATGYDAPVITDVIDGYSAQEAGMQAGDTIVSLDHFHVHFYSDVSAYSYFHSGETVTVTYKRDGVKYKATLTPAYDEETGRYLYGFSRANVYEKRNFFENIGHAFFEVRYYIYVTLESLKMLVTGHANFNDLSGPVGIVKAVGDDVQTAASYGGAGTVFLTILNWGIMLSANLGVMNLLPIPAIDGGRIFFMFVELLRGGKKIDPNKEGLVHLIGIVLLLLLMVVVMFNDIRKLFQ